MTRRKGIILGVVILALVAAGVSAYYAAFLQPYWTGPSYMVTDGGIEDDGCWEITGIIGPRMRLRPDGSHEVLEIKPVYWSEIEVRQVERTQAHRYEKVDELPEGSRIAHGRSGVVSVGDVACTGLVSQIWLYTPHLPKVAVFIVCFGEDCVPF